MPDQEVGPIVLTFGGGLNTRRRSADIDINECVEGVNFDLDQQFLSLQKRKAFDLVATAPNGGEILGYAQLIKRDGTISTLIQAGNTVYTWDHASAFTSVGTVSASAKLRGPREHNFTLDEYVIITDIARQEVVKKWDGTTFSSLAHNLGVSFYAKYCRVHRERAFFANVKAASTELPHMVVGSQLSDAEVLSTADRPASTLSLADPFYLLTPDLRPINGLEDAFGTFIVSSKRGQLYQIVGSSAFDYEIKDFYPGSSVSGDEAMVNIGNDIALGLPARIESLSGTINYGDVQSDDLTLPISPSVSGVTSWTLAYDRKQRRLYCFPDNQSACWVLFKPLLDSQKQWSPWAKWTTGHSSDFSPSTVMSMIDKTTNEDTVYFGDSLGRIFQFEGSSARDGGTDTVTVSRTTGLIRGFPEGDVFDVDGWVLYRKNVAATVTLTFQFAGEGAFDKSLVITLPASDNLAVYNGTGSGSAYYGGTSYYGSTFSDRLARQRFGPPGLNANLQVKVDVESEGDIDVQEVGFTFRTAKA
jgi:hypothetical protein